MVSLDAIMKQTNTNYSYIIKSNIGTGGVSEFDVPPLCLLPPPMSDLFLLCYWIRGQSLSSLCLITISKSATITYLRELLQKAHPHTFHSVDGSDIMLYKPTRALAEPYDMALSNFLLSQCGSALLGHRTLSDLFPSEPPEGCIHIIVGMYQSWFRPSCAIQ